MKKKKKVKKINYRRVMFFIFLLFFLAFIVFSIFQIPLKNIYVYDNNILSDQEIIELSKLNNYPEIFKFRKNTIKERLEKNVYIKSATVERKKFSEVHIKVEENTPIFNINYDNETVLSDGQKVSKFFNVPVLINYVPDVVFEEFRKSFSELNSEALSKISEIQYIPNEVDSTRFLFYMTDGNHVLINNETMTELDNYIVIMENIITNFGNQKGTLHLDAGGYFTTFE